MRLSELLESTEKVMPAKAYFNVAKVMVEGITDNTEEVRAGFVFVCIKGTRFDGHSAAEEMLEKGAVCVVAEHDLGLKNQIVVEDTRKFYGLLCAAWFKNPQKYLKLIGITGTNGKTTIASMIRDILTDNGRKTGFIGTTGVTINGNPVSSDNSTPTTPRVYELYNLLYEMVKSGCDTVVMEVSSFALVQNRIGPAVFDFAVFTNLTQDHLDYHGDMEEYYLAKKILFTDHCKTAVINVDDDYGRRLREELGRSVEIITYGFSEKADIRGDNIRTIKAGEKFWISVNSKSFPVNLNMIGRYNVSNALAAITICLKMGVGINNIINSLGLFRGVRGRCEILSSDHGFLIICDYAHSPDALENMLPNIREHTSGRLICLFGCGGDRDRTKRPLMAHAAESNADMLIITSDNPRNEDPDAIIDEITSGLSGIKPYIRIADRRAAIKCAVAIAEKGDTIVLAGKGHEDYQILADDLHIHFDEREIVQEIMHGYKKPAYNPELHETLTVTEIIDAVNGNPQNVRDFSLKVNADSIFSDSRTIVRNGVFIAIKGEHFDGHDFVEKAVRNGALFAITEQAIPNIPCVTVKNTRKALLDLARYYRMKFENLTLVGITGSVGKTTTKNMVALALSASRGVYKTQGNHNNEIGLPFTLFKINSSCSAAVIEMGMSDSGEIERLSKTARPNVCLITNIGDAHIEKLGSREAILDAKLEIIKGADKKAPLILNIDDPLLRTTADEYDGYRKVITYAVEDKNADYYAGDIKTYSDRMYFNVYHDGEIITDVSLFCIGRHNIYNALAAITVAHYLGADPVAAAEMLCGYQKDSLRQNIQKRGKQTLLVDCYNASPTSMKAAIDVLCSMTPKNNGRRAAVLGDMLELGEKSEQLHREIGEYAVKKGINMLVCYGKEAKHIAERAGELGLNAGYSPDKKMVLNFLKFKLKPDDIVLFKASRGVHLEEIIEEFYKDC